MSTTYSGRWRLVLLVLLFGAGRLHAAATQTATVLVFSQHDEGGASYEARMLVTPRFLRMDNGKDAGGFILFNRVTHTIYSISQADRTIMVIPPGKMVSGQPARVSERVVRDRGRFPSIAGRKVVHYTFFTDGKRCLDVYAAAGLLPAAVAALREYQLALVPEQVATEAKTPPFMRSVCDISNYIFRPARYLDFGFPVRQSDASGTTRQLLSFHTQVPVASVLFSLPEGYRRFSVRDMAGQVAP